MYKKNVSLKQERAVLDPRIGKIISKKDIIFSGKTVLELEEGELIAYRQKDGTYIIGEIDVFGDHILILFDYKNQTEFERICGLVIDAYMFDPEQEQIGKLKS
ncbi:hypothetical protein HOC37_02020 [bacterium]|nr:hypothetical protein [bacterium]MBT7088185.1 hypothetical protein [bacterium]